MGFRSDLEIFIPFVWLPDRSLKDYYELFKNRLVSLKGVQKKVKGQEGRGPPTGTSIYKTWDALQDETKFIWLNAKEYNEDGSDIYNLAEEFRALFLAKLTKARKQAPEPKTSLKINMAPKQSIKLKFGGAKGSPDPSTRPGTPGAGTPGIIVDNDALERQRASVLAGMNGGRPPSTGSGIGRNPFGSSARSGSTPIPPMQRSLSAASPPQTNGVKHEGQSPALNNVRPTNNPQSQPLLSASALPPPSHMSGSPLPQAAAQQQPQYNNHYYAPSSNLPVGVESRFRPAGQCSSTLYPVVLTRN